MTLQIDPLTPSFGVEVRGDLPEILALDRDRLLELLRLHGAAVFRDTGASQKDYEDVTRRLSNNFLIHHGSYKGEERLLMNEDGTTQTVAPGHSDIPPHVERGYAPPIPDVQSFYCIQPAEDGGPTTLYDGVDFLQSLSPTTRRFFVENRMRWVLRVPPPLWQRTLQTTDHGEAMIRFQGLARYMTARNPGQEATCQLDGDELIVDFLTPATRRTPRKDGDAYVNSSLSWFVHWRGDREIDLRTEAGDPFPVEPLAEALERGKQTEVPVRLAVGEFVLLDNHSVLHGRLAFSDKRRKVVTRMFYVH